MWVQRYEVSTVRGSGWVSTNAQLASADFNRLYTQKNFDTVAVVYLAWQDVNRSETSLAAVGFQRWKR